MASASAITPEALLAAIVAQASPNLTAVQLGSHPTAWEPAASSGCGST
jgi:hypothetical protein